MRVFYCKDFEGIWPVGVAAVIVAEDITTACSLLASEVTWDKHPERWTIQEVDTKRPQAIVLNNGDY
ncbi:MAG: hypothetical protein ACYTBJ_02450 [Planctomycetota bacterium]|jgi:hypothetical protein